MSTFSNFSTRIIFIGQMTEMLFDPLVARFSSFSLTLI